MQAANLKKVFRGAPGKKLQVGFGLARREELLLTKSVPWGSGYFFPVLAGNIFANLQLADIGKYGRLRGSGSSPCGLASGRIANWFGPAPSQVVVPWRLSSWAFALGCGRTGDVSKLLIR